MFTGRACRIRRVVWARLGASRDVCQRPWSGKRLSEPAPFIFFSNEHQIGLASYSIDLADVMLHGIHWFVFAKDRAGVRILERDGRDGKAHESMAKRQACIGIERGE